MEDYENDEEEKEIIYWKVGSIQSSPSILNSNPHKKSSEYLTKNQINYDNNRYGNSKKSERTHLNCRSKGLRFSIIIIMLETYFNYCE